MLIVRRAKGGEGLEIDDGVKSIGLVYTDWERVVVS